MRGKLKAGSLFALMIWTASAAAGSILDSAKTLADQGHGFVTAGVTHGGKNMANLISANGGLAQVQAGDFWQIGGGMHWHLDDKPIEVTLAGYYHFDSVDADTSTGGFDRYPIELLGYYRVNPEWRVGGGLRYVLWPTMETIKSGSETNIDYKNAPGLVFEGGYGFSDRFWVNARYVIEQYQARKARTGAVTINTSALPKTNGSHFGVNFSFIFK